jgi:hypothetical protein
MAIWVLDGKTVGCRKGVNSLGEIAGCLELRVCIVVFYATISVNYKFSQHVAKITQFHSRQFRRTTKMTPDGNSC